MSSSYQYSQGDIVSGYVLLNKLGRGGNGEVWIAEKDAEKPVAIKILKMDLREDRVQRFRIEIEVMKSLRENDHVMEILDSKHEDGDFSFYVMPVAIKISDHIAQEEDIVETLRVSHTVAKTLAALAENQIFHRDIKPDNLLVVDGVVKISDFGLSSTPDKEALTQPLTRLGPFYYCAPEMFRPHKNIDKEKADVYSFCRTIRYLVTGRDNREYAPAAQILAHEELRTEAYSTGFASDLLEKSKDSVLRIIEMGTHPDPDLRRTFAQISSELDAIISIQTEVQATQAVTAEHIPEDIIVRLKKTQADRDNREVTRRMVQNLINEITQELTKLASELSTQGVHFGGVGGGHGLMNDLSPPESHRTSVYHDSASGVLEPENGLVFVCGIKIWSNRNNDARLRAVHLGRAGGIVQTYWEQGVEGQLGSADLSLKVSTLLESFRLAVVDSFVRFMKQ